MVENGGGEEEEEKEVLKGEKVDGLEWRREREYEIQTQHVYGSGLHDGVYLLPVLIPRPVEFARWLHKTCLRSRGFSFFLNCLKKFRWPIRGTSRRETVMWIYF